MGNASLGSAVDAFSNLGRKFGPGDAGGINELPTEFRGTAKNVAGDLFRYVEGGNLPPMIANALKAFRSGTRLQTIGSLDDIATSGRALLPELGRVYAERGVVGPQYTRSLEDLQEKMLMEDLRARRLGLTQAAGYEAQLYKDTYNQALNLLASLSTGGSGSVPGSADFGGPTGEDILTGVKDIMGAFKGGGRESPPYDAPYNPEYPSGF